VSFGRFHYRWSLLAPMLLLFLSSSLSASIIVIGLDGDYHGVNLVTDNTGGSSSTPPVENRDGERPYDLMFGLRQGNGMSTGSSESDRCCAVAPIAIEASLFWMVDFGPRSTTDCYKLFIPVGNPNELLKVPITIQPIIFSI
jgi:hypothetical protein